jgi:hypothetical protein
MTMNYFKVLGLLFGLIAFLKPFYMHILPWNENALIAKAYPEKRPKWIVWVAVIGLFFVGFTWYMEITTDIKYSTVISIMFSLTAVKAIYFLFNYKKFFRWVAGMLRKDKGKKIVLIDMLAGLFGLTMIVLSLIFL